MGRNTGLDLMGTAEVIEHLGVTRPTLARYRQGQFPEPACVLRCGPVWLTEDVRAWERPEPQPLGERPQRAPSPAAALLRRLSP